MRLGRIHHPGIRPYFYLVCVQWPTMSGWPLALDDELHQLLTQSPKPRRRQTRVLLRGCRLIQVDYTPLLQVNRWFENPVIVLSGQATYQPAALCLWQQFLQQTMQFRVCR